MRKPRLIASSLIFALAISGCAKSGSVRPVVVCPQLPEAPANLMQPPSYETKVRAILFDSPQRPTPKSVDSKK